MATSKLGLVTLDIADVPFGYNERVEFNSNHAANMEIIDRGTLGYQASALNLFVDQLNGSDANDGLTESTAFKTLEAAKSRIGYTISDQVVVTIASGNYAETLGFDFNMTISGSKSGSLAFRSDSWVPFTPATGIATGTFDASFAGQAFLHTAVVTGAGWTANDLIGVFFKITSGTNSGSFYPAGDNSATTVNFGFPTDRTTSGGKNLTGQSFQLVTPGVTISRTANPAVSTVPTMFINVNSPARSTTRGLIRFENMNIHVGAGFTGVEIGNGSVLLERVRFQSTSSTNIIQLNKTGIRLGMTDCVFRSPGNSQYWVNDACGQNIVSLSNCVGYNTSRGFVIGVGSSYGVSGLFTSLGAYVFDLRSGGSLSISTNLLVKNCQQVFWIQGQNASVTVTGSAPGVVQMMSCSALVKSFDGATNVSDHFNGKFSGVRVEAMTCPFMMSSSFNNIRFVQQSLLLSSSNYGVNLSPARGYGFNQFTVDGTVIMGANALGDFTLNSTTTSSLAELRADSDKDILEAVRLNRLCEQ